VDETQVCSWNLPQGDSRTSFSTAFSAAVFGKSSVRSIAASDDWVLAGVADGYALILGAEKGDLRASLDRSRGEIACVALSEPAGLAAAGTTNGQVVVAEVPSGRIVASLEGHRQNVTAAAFTRSGDLLATASADMTIRLWRRQGEGYETYVVLRGLPTAAQTLRFSASGDRLFALLRGERAVRVWRLDVLREIWETMGVD
jgi:WD40 repeat protein